MMCLSGPLVYSSDSNLLRDIVRSPLFLSIFEKVF